MSKQSWKGSTLLNPEPPVLVSCGGLDKPNLITIGWTGTICTQPSMVSISVRPERYSHHLIQESGQFAINLPTEALVRSVDWCGVKSGRDVDKFAACEQGTYDLILMDVQMPVMNGRDATKAIRALDRRDAKEIPIYALSADAFVEDERLSIESGMNGHLSKPIDYDALFGIIGQTIQKEVKDI